MLLSNKFQLYICIFYYNLSDFFKLKNTLHNKNKLKKISRCKVDNTPIKSENLWPFNVENQI